MRVYRASSLGYSLCQLVCGHLGYEPAGAPEWLQEKFDEGHRLEPLAIEKFALAFQYGEFIDSAQMEINLEVIPDIATVQGHLDGILHFQDRPGKVLEIKTMNDKTWQQVVRQGFEAGGILEKYKWQISAYMLGTGLGALMVFWNKSTEELFPLEVDAPFYSISDIANKLEEAEAYIEEGDIPAGCTDYPCPYYYLHEEKDAKTIADADDELEAVLSAWYEADKRAKIYEGEKKVLREQIIELIGEGDLAAPVIKARNGVRVETYWQEGKEYTVKQTSKWVTKVTGPRGKSGV